MAERGKSMRLFFAGSFSRSVRGPTCTMRDFLGREIRRSRSACIKNLRAFLLVNTIRSYCSSLRSARTACGESGKRASVIRASNLRTMVFSLTEELCGKLFAESCAFLPRSARFFAYYFRSVCDHTYKTAFSSGAERVCAGGRLAAAAHHA